MQSVTTSNITFKNANLKQQPPTMCLIGNSANNNCNNNISNNINNINNSSVNSPPVQFITKIEARM